MTIRLKITKKTGNQPYLERPLELGQSVKVGRDARVCAISLETDPLLSAKHFQIDYRPTGIVITDLQSTNRTTVNGTRLERGASTTIESELDKIVIVAGKQFQFEIERLMTAPSGAGTAEADSDQTFYEDSPKAQPERPDRREDVAKKKKTAPDSDLDPKPRPKPSRPKPREDHSDSIGLDDLGPLDSGQWGGDKW